MKKLITRFNIGILFFITLFTVVIVRADSPFSVTIHQVKSSEFPQVIVALDIYENGSPASNLTPKNIQIKEGGEVNNGPLVLLPPGASPNKIDLFILLDRSGNTKDHEEVIKGNIKALAQHLNDMEIDLNIKLLTFGGNDTAYSLDVQSYSGDVGRFRQEVDELVFDTARPARVFGLDKIFSLAAQTARPGAEKVALIINGSQFYDVARGDTETTHSLHEAIARLAEKNFITFVLGQPIKQLHEVTSENSEDSSLSHHLPGGYLGSFASDLTVIYDLLSMRANNKYVLQYFSNLPKSGASGAQSSLYIDTFLVSQFNYNAISISEPVLEHTPTDALIGADYIIEANVSNNGQLISGIEMVYLNAANAEKKLMLEHRPGLDTPNLLNYKTVIPAAEMPGDQLIYNFVIRTPFYESGSIADAFTTQIIEFDDGIELHSIPVNNNEVVWSWTGPTVDMGTRYQLWGGDEMIIDTTQRRHSIPTGDCKKYQMVKLKVLLRNNADHPLAGSWSLFSREAERYVGSEATITEKEGITVMMNCVEEKSATSVEGFVQSQDDYRESEKLSLNKTLYYLTGIVNPALRVDVPLNSYRLLYSFMQAISSQEAKDYTENTIPIPQSILYKAVTNVNQSADFEGKFAKALEEYIRRISGNTSF